MSLSMIKEFMNEVVWGDLATTDGQRVGVRPMAGWAWVGKEIWCAAGKKQEKIKHIAKVPYGEYCFTKTNGEHVRIGGTCCVSEDIKEKTKLYQLLPALQNYYSGPQDPEYVIVKMKPSEIRWMGLKDEEYRNIPIK